MTQRSIYQTEHPYHLTTNTTYHISVFDDINSAARLSEIIQEACVMHGFILIVHAILPNHVHMLVQPNASHGLESPRFGYNNFGHNNIINLHRGFSNPHPYNISDLMKSIKGTYSRSLHRGKICQPRYNFRIVISESQLENTFTYIYYNFRKHGLSERYGREPYVYVAPEYGDVADSNK